MVHHQVKLFSETLNQVDGILHDGRVSYITITFSKPRKDLCPVIYYEHTADIPKKHRLKGFLDSTEGYLVIQHDPALRAIEKLVQRDLDIAPDIIILQLAIYFAWRKVQYRQERSKPREIPWENVFLPLWEILDCCNDKSRISLEQELTFHERDYQERWSHSSQSLIKANAGSVKWAEAACRRMTEADSVARIGMNLPSVEDIISFLQDIKARADAKITQPS